MATSKKRCHGAEKNPHHSISGKAKNPRLREINLGTHCRSLPLCGFFFAGAVGYLWRLAGQRGPELGVEIGQGMTAPELYDSRWKLFAAGQPAF